MNSHDSRRGAVLVSALVCLLVALSIVAATLASTLARRVQLRRERDARQAAILVVVARDLATARLASDSTYSGHVWKPAVLDSPSQTVAEVEIEVERSATDQFKVQVAATYPAGSPGAVRRSQTFHIPNPTKSSD